MTPSQWTEARRARIAELWSQDMTAKQIAENMGGFEHCEDGGRNAVIAAAHRFKLPSRGPRCVDPVILAKRAEIHKRQQAESQRNRRGTQQAQEPKPVVHFVAPLNIPFADLRRFSNTEANQCRHIGADEGSPLFLSCGNETAPGQSYCAHCHTILYRPRQSGSFAVAA